MRRRAGGNTPTTALWSIVVIGLSAASSLGLAALHPAALPPSSGGLDVGALGVAHPVAAFGEPATPTVEPGQAASPRGSSEGPYWLGGHIAPIAPPGGAGPAGVVGANVVPTAYYSTEPAPLGVGDFGIDASGSAYTYYTDAFRATAHLNAYLTTANLGGYSSNETTFQLNVVVVLARGSALAEYWIQDVPILNTSSHHIDIENNIWNFSGGSPLLPTNSVRGNGTVYTINTGSGVEQYYADGVSSGYPGAGATLSFPANVSAEVTASNLSGSTHVGFEYNDGYGWATYDNVTFPWTHGWTLRGFEVTGSSYNPFGLFNDAEWIIGGPGGGSSMAVQRANFSMDLEFFNGHNFDAVPNAFDFGSDTAETASNVASSLPSGRVAAIPANAVKPGSGSLRFLYGQGNVSTVNVSAPVPNGTLLAGSSATGYRGYRANVTLLPGSYLFSVENRTSVVASKNESLTAREYLPLSFAEFGVAPGKSQSETRVTASGDGFVAASKVSVDWPGNSTPQCQATAASNGSFSCTFLVPFVAAASYNLTASDNASSNDVAWSILVVTTNMTVAASASAVSTDLGGALEFWANASGGFPPYSSFLWNFGDGALVHTTVGTVNHTYAKAGAYSLSVAVRDRAGDSISSGLSVRIRADPTVSAPLSNRSTADVGQSVGFDVVPSSGLGPYTFVWAGLPQGCVVTGASATCANLSSPGTYSISVNLTDAQGYSTVGLPLGFEVYADPIVAAFSDLRPFLDVGENLSLLVNASFGSGGFAYTWSGLPVGCAPNAERVDCRVTNASSYLVGVLATDSDGVAAKSIDLPITVYADPTVRLTDPVGNSLDVGQSAGLLAATQGGAGEISYAWTGLPDGCASENLSLLTCVLAQTGTFAIRVTVTDQSGTVAFSDLSLSVHAFPVVQWVRVSETSGDVGRPISFEVAASGGEGTFHYAWTDLPTGCPDQDSAALVCDPTCPGSFSVSVNATDMNNATASTPVTLESIQARPAIVDFSASPTRVVAGYPLTLRAELSGGTGAFTFQWLDLPAGCAPHNLSDFTCRPTASGSYAISVVATDGVGVSVNATVHVIVDTAVLGLAPSEGYAALLLGLAGLAVVVVAVARWVRRSRSSGEPKPPGRAP